MPQSARRRQPRAVAITSTDRIFSLCAEAALKEGMAQNGDTIVVTAGVPLGRAAETNLLKAHVIDEMDG